MKLVIQIPCFNEEDTLPTTVSSLPSKIDGIDEIEVLIIDDGSVDRTADVALELGVTKVVRNKKNIGLARTFRVGLNEALSMGADIIVNTDADNQYSADSIKDLIAPVLSEKADIVIGDRQTANSNEFSWLKRLLQRFGSKAVERLTGQKIPDAVSGFRAMSREAALRLNVISPFSYTIEMTIQAGKKHMNIMSVPIKTNPKTRDSRLFKSIPHFIGRQGTTMVRMYAMYQPLRIFSYIGSLLIFIGLLPIIRFLVLYFMGQGDGHLQSLILGGVLVTLGFLSFLIALLADLVGFNRQLTEISLEKIRKIELMLSDKQEKK